MNKIDFKKLYKDLYAPGTEPSLIDVPAMKFLMVEGKGNPNTPGGEYQQAVELLYALTYTIKMAYKRSKQPGITDYVVPPLEGLWWLEDQNDFDFTKKDQYCWISMIRQPDFLSEDMFEAALKEVAKKKPTLDVGKARLELFREGLCVQCMHIGSFDEESATVAKIDAYVEEIGKKNAIGTLSPEGKQRLHHEIYVSNPLKCNPSKRKTILRHPVMD